jgi:hypothetical protein
MEDPVACPFDPWDLADSLAEIARTTTDSATGLRLMQLVVRLLEAAGLPPEDAGGGDLPPSGWVATQQESPC